MQVQLSSWFRRSFGLSALTCISLFSACSGTEQDNGEGMDAPDDLDGEDTHGSGGSTQLPPGAGGGQGGETTSGGSTAAGGQTGAGGNVENGSGGSGPSDPSAELNAALRNQIVRLQIQGTESCLNATSPLSLGACGGDAQSFRVQVLSSDYLSIVDDTSGRCLQATGTGLVLTECTNAPEQQFSHSGATREGYQLTSFSQKKPIDAGLQFSGAAARFAVRALGAADPLAVVVGERPIGWATMSADIPVPDGAVPNGDEQVRKVGGTTGGGSWEAARTKNFSNVFWFKPGDFTGSNREAAIQAVSQAASGNEARILLFAPGVYDFSLSTPKAVNSCRATCSSSSATYTQVDGFCNTSSPGYTANGYQDKTRTINLGSNKTILGLGAGAELRHLMLRAVRNNNLIFRNLAFRQLPGDVRAWNDALLFYPADHVWVDHVSISGFGRGAIVLSGTRVTSGSSFYTYRDAGWMTFSWTSIDSSEPWRCSGAEDSPYPFFTTENPGLTFEHAHFKRGHGRNPAIDGESAHFINTAWEDVTDGLDGRGGAKLRVEGCYFEGNKPIRMDNAARPVVYAPWNGSLLTDKRYQVIFAGKAWDSIKDDWGRKGLDIATLNTNAVPAAPYPYGLDPDPRKVLETVQARGGVGKGGFPTCSVSATDKSDYACP